MSIRFIMYCFHGCFSWGYRLLGLLQVCLSIMHLCLHFVCVCVHVTWGCRVNDYVMWCDCDLWLFFLLIIDTSFSFQFWIFSFSFRISGAFEAVFFTFPLLFETLLQDVFCICWVVGVAFWCEFKEPLFICPFFFFYLPLPQLFMLFVLFWGYLFRFLDLLKFFLAERIIRSLFQVIWF